MILCTGYSRFFILHLTVRVFNAKNIEVDSSSVTFSRLVVVADVSVCKQCKNKKSNDSKNSRIVAIKDFKPYNYGARIHTKRSRYKTYKFWLKFISYIRG